MSAEYDLNQIKKRYEAERKKIADWLKTGNRDPRLIGSFVMRMTFNEVEAMIKNIESLQSLLEDDMK